MSKQGSNKPTKDDSWPRPKKSKRGKRKYCLECRVNPERSICKMFPNWAKWSKHHKKYITKEARQEAMDRMNKTQDVFQYRLPEDD